jgi:hypothetical protein
MSVRLSALRVGRTLSPFLLEAESIQGPHPTNGCRETCFRSRGLASGIAAAGSYILAFLASKTFLSLKSALSLHGVFWLYGSLGFVGFFAIYWTFSETEGRSLEEIEEFYKKGMRGKIPKRAVADETSKEPSINFSASASSVIREKENEINGKDGDRVLNNMLLTTQSFRNNASKSYSSSDMSNGDGRSTDTLDTAFTVSTVDLHDPNSSSGDIGERRTDEVHKMVGETSEEMKCREEKREKEQVAEEEISDILNESEGPSSSESKITEGKCSKRKATDEYEAKEDGNCTKEKVEVHIEDVEERTKM